MSEDTDKRIADLQKQIDELKADKAKREEATTGRTRPLGEEVGGQSRRLADQLLSLPPDAMRDLLKSSATFMEGLNDDIRRTWWHGNVPKKEKK